MSQARTVVKNIGFLFFADIFGKALSFILILLIARYLGQVGLGKYSFAFAFVGMFSILADFGITILMVKEIAKDKKQTQRYFNNIVALRSCLSIATLVTTSLAIYFLAESWETILIVWIAGLASFFDNITLSFKNLFSAYEQTQYYSIITLAERAVALVLAIFLLVTGHGLLSIIPVFVVSYFFSLVLSVILVAKKIIKVRLEFDFPFWLEILKKSFPFWLTTIFLTIYFRTDTMMLTALKGYAVVGLYNAAYKITETFVFIPSVVMTAIYPVMSRFHVTSKQSLDILFEKSFGYLLMIGLPIAMGLTVLAGKIIPLIYGQDFLPSAAALQILCWTMVLSFVNYLMGYLLNSIDKQRLFTLSIGICVVVNVILNFLLIPVYSFKGAAIATLAAEAINFSLLYYFTASNGHRLNLIKTTYRIILAAVFMGGVVYYLRWLPIFYLIPTGVILYFAALLLLKGIGKEEFDIVKSLTEKNRKIH